MHSAGDPDTSFTSVGPPPSAGRAPSDTWAAILSFVAAFGFVAGGVWSFVANALTDDSIAEVGDRLPAPAKSALAAIGTLNTASAAAGAVIAVGFVFGGVTLLCRRPSGRTIVAVTCVVDVVATIAAYAIGSSIWSRVDVAMRGATALEVTRFGPGLGSVIRECVFAAVILFLLLWPVFRRVRSDAASRLGATPTTGAAPGTPRHAGSPVPLPLPSGGTAITAAVLSLAGSVVFTVGLITGTVSLVGPSDAGDTLLLAAVTAALASPFALGLIVGGILLLRRWNAGRFVIVIVWSIVILVCLGLLAVVATSPSRPAGALWGASVGVLFIVSLAVAAGVCALVGPTRRWCFARTGAAHIAPPPTAPRGVSIPETPAGDPAMVTPAPDTVIGSGTTPRRRSPRGWVWAAVAGSVTVVVVIAVVAFTGVPRIADAPPSPHVSVHSYGEQVTLPFGNDQLNDMQGIAIGSTGTVYLLHGSFDTGPAVWSLAPGAAAPVRLPFSGLVSPHAVAVDSAGTVYVGDARPNRVLALRAGATAPTVLPFGAGYLSVPMGIAIDTHGTVYVAQSSYGARALHEGANVPVNLRFGSADALAVDDAGTLYAVDSNTGRVVILTAGAATATELPFTGLKNPQGIAVGGDGTVYVADTQHGRVLALPSGSTTPTVLPITGMSLILGVAVDGTGNLYAANFDKVIKLPVSG